MDSIYLAVEGDKWQAIVNRLMNLHILYNVGNFLTEDGFSRTLHHRASYSGHHSYKEPSNIL
jgi:hypothetical protein